VPVVEGLGGWVWPVDAGVVLAIKVVDCWPIGVEFVKSDVSVWPVGGLFEVIVDRSMPVVEGLGGWVLPGTVVA